MFCYRLVSTGDEAMEISFDWVGNEICERLHVSIFLESRISTYRQDISSTQVIWSDLELVKQYESFATHFPVS